MIIFHNPGLLDLRCIRAFGVNVKPNTDSPLGQFGTGLKVGIAILLRLKHRVTLYLGLDRYTFRTKSITIRDKAFDFVTMTHPDGTVEELAFNTHVGEHWEDWTPYRELASNALDEGGSTYAAPNALPYTPRADETVFVIEGDAIEAAHAARSTIFLQSTPIHVTPEIEVHRGESQHAYYRGIRVLDLPQPSLFTYNLRSAVDLTEDRTLKNAYDLDRCVAKMLCTGADDELLTTALIAREGSYEHTVNSVWGEVPDDPFMAVYDGLRRGGRIMELTRFATGVYLKRRGHLPIPDPVALTRIQSIQLDRAVAFCTKLGWTVGDYPIVTVPQQRNGLLAWAQDQTIVLTTQVFDKGTTEVACTLLEEWLHLKHGFSDCTRAFQTHLFQTIITMGQQLNGEPL